MPNPVSSSNSVPSSSSSYDPYADDVGQVSRADAPNSSEAQPQALRSEAPPASSPATAKLVSSVPAARSALPPAAPPASTANNNAQRTSEIDGVKPYWTSGKTADGGAVYAGGAMLKGRDRSGAEIEVLSASVQIGTQTELQIGGQRIAGTSGSLTGSVEAFTLRANVGMHNDDGSTGLNIGATANATSFEGTVGGATSATYGVGAGVGYAGSVGVRDQDGDGKKEICAKVSWGPITLGACVEDPR